MVSSNKVSRPLTAYYSGRIGSATTQQNTFMRNAKLSERLSTANGRFNPVITEEADEAEMQIDWFERNNIDLHKKNRYAKINLDEAYNYKEQFAQHIAQKKQKIESIRSKAGGIIKPSSSPTSQKSPQSKNFHQPSTNRSGKQVMQHSH